MLLSSAGLLARTNHAQPLPPVGARANHDLIVSKIISTARGDCGLVTSAGRLIKISALDLPTVPATAHAPNLQGGTHVSELVTLGGRREGALPDNADRGFARPGARHGAGCGEAGQSGGAR